MYAIGFAIGQVIGVLIIVTAVVTIVRALRHRPTRWVRRAFYLDWKREMEAIEREAENVRRMREHWVGEYHRALSSRPPVPPTWLEPGELVLRPEPPRCRLCEASGHGPLPVDHEHLFAEPQWEQPDFTAVSGEDDGVFICEVCRGTYTDTRYERRGPFGVVFKVCSQSCAFVTGT